MTEPTRCTRDDCRIEGYRCLTCRGVLLDPRVRPVRPEGPRVPLPSCPCQAVRPSVEGDSEAR